MLGRLDSVLLNLSYFKTRLGITRKNRTRSTSILVSVELHLLKKTEAPCPARPPPDDTYNTNSRQTTNTANFKLASHSPPLLSSRPSTTWPLSPANPKITMELRSRGGKLPLASPLNRHYYNLSIVDWCPPYPLPTNACQLIWKPQG